MKKEWEELKAFIKSNIPPRYSRDDPYGYYNELEKKIGKLDELMKELA